MNKYDEGEIHRDGAREIVVWCGGFVEEMERKVKDNIGEKEKSCCSMNHLK